MPVPVTICVTTFGDHPELARQCLGSILRHCDRSLYRLAVGADIMSPPTLAYLRELQAEGAIDRLEVSSVNIGKCPMMRRLFAQVDTEFVWWFDDDSYVNEASALPGRLKIARAAAPNVVMWGKTYWCDHPRAFWDGDAVAFVRSAKWYRGLTPPFWEPGGKGELNFGGKGTGDGRWFFTVGGGWFVRFAALKQIDWPDPRLVTLGDDVFLGEALRQQGWAIQDIGELGMPINTAPRRWSPSATDEARRSNRHGRDSSAGWR